MKTMLSKLTSVLLCLAMLLTMCSFAMAEAGTYTGVGDSEIGGKGAIEVSVTVDENGVVTDIQVTKNGARRALRMLLWRRCRAASWRRSLRMWTAFPARQ